jgi:hypothetical protein
MHIRCPPYSAARVWIFKRYVIKRVTTNAFAVRETRNLRLLRDLDPPFEYPNLLFRIGRWIVTTRVNGCTLDMCDLNSWTAAELSSAAHTFDQWIVWMRQQKVPLTYDTTDRYFDGRHNYWSEVAKKDWNVLTHCDLHAANMIARENRLVGLIDVGEMGFYPYDMEAVRIIRLLSREPLRNTLFYAILFGKSESTLRIRVLLQAAAHMLQRPSRIRDIVKDDVHEETFNRVINAATTF